MKPSILISLLALLVAATLYRLDVDKRFYTIINSHRKPFIDKVMIAITQLASPSFLVAINIVLLFLSTQNHNYWLELIPFSTAITSILNSTIKLFFKRIRPNGEHLVTEKSYSFPSGHSMAAGCFYLMIATLLFNETGGYFFFFIASAIIALIGYSRIYLGVHYPVDVLVGVALGILLAILFIHLGDLYYPEPLLNRFEIFG